MTDFDRKVLAWAAVVVAAIFIFGAVGMYIHDVRDSLEPEEGNLHLVVSDITVDITADRIFASDFVRFTRVDTDRLHVGAVEYEMYRMGFEDEFWQTSHNLECEDVGTQEYWIRALYADPYGQATPVRATLEVVDAGGQCDEPMFEEWDWQFEDEEEDE
jgi:hypothetical protein